MRLLWLLMVLVLASCLAVIHAWALSAYLYWRIVWLDMPVHLLGGLTIGMGIIALLRVFRPWVFVVLMVLAIVGWEAFELLIGIPREANFVFDSALDVLMGALGGVVAYFLARLTLWRSA